MFFKFLILVHVCVAFPLKCPEPAQWSLRGKSHCPDPSKYSCLQNDLINGYSENCTIFDFLQPGRKHVLRGGLDADICSSERYQPWPITFYTNVGASCIFLKSTCNDEGQVLFSHGDRNTDRTCICDYTRGYAFLVKPRKQCFCVPSEEDCSCYIKTCQDQKYALSSDYECIHSNKNESIHTCKPINHGSIQTVANQSGIGHTVQRLTTISTPDEYRTGVAIFVTLFLPVIICLSISLTVVRRHCCRKKAKYNIPLAIQNMDERNKQRYLQLLRSGKVKRYHIKIMILGKESVGKTSLMRRLLNESIDDVKSTDGIDIVKRCKVDVNSGEWVFCEGDTTDYRFGMAIRETYILKQNIEAKRDDTTGDTTVTAIRKTDILNHDIESKKGKITEARYELLSRNEDESDRINSSKKTDAPQKSILSILPSQEKIVHHNPTEEVEKEDLDEKEESIHASNDLSRNIQQKYFTSKPNNKTKEETENIDTLLQIGNKAKISDDEFAECTLMDFAGQTEYYSTHQTFLTKNAIYLIVTTLKNDEDPFADSVPEQEKISFWIDNILCYASDKTKTKTSEHLNPPIVMVCTGNEPVNIKDLNKRKKDLENNLTTMLKNTKRIDHIRGGIMHVSNTISHKKVFDNLRRRIFDVAKSMPVWGEDYPVRFIKFERTLNTLRRKGNNVLTLEDVKMQAKKEPISLISDFDVILFLKFQHQVGNLIFFEDRRLKDCVIINPSWLIDAFKCIVNADNLPSITSQPHYQTLLDFRETGFIRKEILKTMLQSKCREFLDNLDYIIGVMKKFDIIVEGNEDELICPSAVTKLSCSFETICEGMNNDKCFRSPWLCIEFDFLPPALYNHLLVFCMRDSIFEKPKLYHEIGLFCYRKTNAMKLCVICKSNNTIAVQIWSRSHNENPSGQITKNISDGNTLYTNLSRKINDITKKYEFIVTYTFTIKCGDSKYQATDDRYSEKDIENSPSGYCSYPEHGSHDNLDTMFDFWLKQPDASIKLIDAVCQGNTDIVDSLIGQGIDINLQDENYKTALHLAVLNEKTEVVKWLVDAGIEVNVQEKNGNSALHFAAMTEKTEVVKLLIDARIDLNLQEKNGKTALHFAAIKENTEVAKMLIDAGIDINLQEKNGETALHLAALNSRTETAKLLIDAKIDVDLFQKDGNTALHVAAARNNMAIVNLLLDGHCDPNICNEEGRKPNELAESFRIRRLIKDYESRLPGLPIEVKKMDKKSALIFSSLLGEDSYLHFESRVMLAGDQGTGKTTIARYLVGKIPTRFRKSTDGIELYNGLSYFDRETKEWLGGQQDFSLEEITVSRSLLRGDNTQQKQNFPFADTSSTIPYMSDVTEVASMSTSEEELTHKSNESQLCDDTSSTERFVTESVKATKLPEPQFQTVPGCADSLAISMEKILPGHVAGQKSQRVDNDEIYKSDVQGALRSSERQSDRFDGDGLGTRNDLVVQDYTTENKTSDVTNYGEIYEASFDEYKRTEDSHDASLKSGFTGDLHIETVTQPGIIAKLKGVFGITKQVKEVKVSITKEKFLENSSKVGKKKLHNKKIAPIIIWDFGGHDVFYSTHQTFLTCRAIYIIVLDGSRKLDDPCLYEQYLPGKSGHKTSRDYLLFWINTIVTYCKGSIQGFPKILIVLTHKDQVNANEVEQRRKDIFEEIYKMFHKNPLMQQLVISDKIFVNAKDKHDPEMAKIKVAIIRESERQPTWGEPLPKCFIPLELEFASLIKRNIHLITLEHLEKINSLQPIRPLSEVELKVFLKFQHSIGKLLYFDEHKLDDRIILSPTLLIEAFKSIVTDRQFCEGDKKREEIWDAMGKTGVVSKQAIEGVWKGKKYVKFYQDKDYLLNVMTHLDILVEPMRYNSNRMRIPADFYYVASMVRAKDDSGYLQSAGFTNRSIALAFQTSSFMIPPALSFRFISYCLYVWAVKTYGQSNKDMLFHRSGVFTIDPCLDMYIACEDAIIISRLVHTTSNTLIARDVASSICECLTSALEKISDLYIRTSSDQTQINDTSFVTRICCNSPDNPCFLQVNDRTDKDQLWICPSHGIEHSIHTIMSWIAEKDDVKCEPGCTVTKEDFMRATPTDLHLRRLSLLYSPFEAKEMAIHLGLSNREVETILETEDRKIACFEILRQCRDSMVVTFKDIKEAIQRIGKTSIHILCKLVKGKPIYFDMEPEKWDLVPTAEYIDRLAPLVGKNSLPFLIELGMDFNTWQQISHRQNERDLVRLNKDILEEWRFQFCRMHNLKPTLREIARAFSNIGKNIKIVDNALSDLF